MGSLNFHLHRPHIHFHHHHHHHHQNHHGGSRGNKDLNHIPKGRLSVLVGQGEEQEKFVIPLIYLKHPLFMPLLKEAEDKYEFDYNGPINIPCHIEQFKQVQGTINKEKSQHPHWCFRA